jgi:pyridoxamine 5'-phosphate oxidase
MSEYSHIRRDYTGPVLELDSTVDPLQLIQEWMDAAIEAGNPDPTAMSLSTVDSLGQPTSRIVLLKGITSGGLEFFTNYTSRKAVEIAENPQVGLLFYWPETFRMVRIEGMAYISPKENSDAYFRSRPREHQIGAWASPQSAAIPDMKAVEENAGRYEKLYAGRDIPRPGFWGGYIVIPQYIEFWQGHEGRLHDRFRFQRIEKGWKVERLAP